MIPENYYSKAYREALVGRTITDVFAFSPRMLAGYGWDAHDGEIAVAVALDDGTAVIVMQDAEGNGPGVLDILPPFEDMDEAGGEEA